jgi:poly-beta-1,6-N-acetyl-D-glucosamine synthase
MAALFWTASALLAYTYLGYPLLLRVLVRVRPRPVRVGECDRSLSIVIAARNEEANLTKKIRNLEGLVGLERCAEIVIASDGSTDGTAELLREAGGKIVPVILPESRGKAVALNAAVRVTTGEILVFFDSRQVIEENVLLELCGCFADEEVGAVSGELVLVDADGRPTTESVALYWSIEKMVRRMESATGSVVGVTGAIYAIRRELYVELPEGTILDDVLVPMNVARSGRRVVFQPMAIARDRIFHQPGKEFARKVRTLTGNYQLLQLAPWLLTPRNPLLFRFVSHKLMRLGVPFLLVLTLVSSACAEGVFYRVCFGAQLIFYGLAAWGRLGPSARRFRPVAIAETFTMLNVAAALAFVHFAVGRKKVWG